LSLTTLASPLPWWRDRLLLAVSAVALGWAALSFSWPLSGDAGVFGWMADTVARGGAPYADAWDTKSPGAWLPSLLLQRLTGRNPWSIRVFDLAMLALALLSLRGVARKLEQPGDGRIAVVLYTLWYCSLDYWASAQPDGWVAAWLIAACWCALRASIPDALLAGCLLGLATMVKPFYLGYLVVLLMLVGTAHGRLGRQRVSHAVAVLAGVGLTIAAILGAVRAWGGLDAYWELQRWNAQVYAGFDTPWTTRVPAMFKGMLVMPWGIVAPMALFGAVRPTRKHRRPIHALLIGFAGAVAGVMLQGKGWNYHWLPMLPFLAILSDVGLAALRPENAGEIAGRFRVMALALGLTVAGITPLQMFWRYARSKVSAEAAETYERREFRYYGRDRQSAYHVADSLKVLRQDSTDLLLIWAMHPAVHVLNGLVIPTRFAVIRPLYDGPGTTFRESYRAEFLGEMRATPPRWWLVATPALRAREEELRVHDIADFPEAAALLARDYRVGGQTQDWLIYERRVPGSALR
jgi:hypothetical protein